jgi:hypothetical protein
MAKGSVDGLRPPEGEELAGLLGRSVALWEELRRDLTAEFGPLDEKWSYTSKTGRWSLQLKQHRSKRTIIYMIPHPKHFVSAFALGEKACRAAQSGGLPAPILAAIDSATKYPEGRGVWLEVRSRMNADGVRRLARIKMEN